MGLGWLLESNCLSHTQDFQEWRLQNRAGSVPKSQQWFGAGREGLQCLAGGRECSAMQDFPPEVPLFQLSLGTGMWKLPLPGGSLSMWGFFPCFLPRWCFWNREGEIKLQKSSAIHKQGGIQILGLESLVLVICSGRKSLWSSDCAGALPVGWVLRTSRGFPRHGR